MGGRGSYSYSASMMSSSIGSDSEPLGAYAVASLNRGTAAGTTVDDAIDSFRQQLMGEKVEYYAYIDDAGYIHALGSSGSEGATQVAPLSAIAHESNVSTIVHNHPFGTSDGRTWGGPLSEGDLRYIVSAYNQTGGQINRIVATSNEGTYSAVVTRPVTTSQVSSAAARASSSVSGRTYQSERAMWRAVNDAYTSEMGRIGISITYTEQRKRSSNLVTQRTGTY